VEGQWRVYEQSSAQFFARALGEHDPELLEGRRLCETFAILPVWQTQEMVTVETFGLEAMAHGVHGEQRFEFIRPMELGIDVRGRSKIVGVRWHTKGTLLSVLSEVFDQKGIVCRQQEVLFSLGVWLDPQSEASSGEEVLAPETGAVVSSAFEGHWNAEPAQVSLYADASGDRFEVHTNEAYAQLLGYPSIIMHGMCTMGIATRSIRDCMIGYGKLRLTSLGVRFSAPVVPPVRLVTRVTVEHATAFGVSGRFETLDIDRDMKVLSHGYFGAERPYVASSPCKTRSEVVTPWMHSSNGEL
jgi:acyl dehydratase